MRKQFQDGEDKVELDLIKRHHLKIEPVTYNNVPGLKITPENVIAGQGAIVNIHGGGFIMGTARDRNGLLAATETHLPVYSVNYTLSPEAAAPIALEEAQNFYAGVVNELGEQPVRVMGSSAGSTIAASMLVRAHAAGLKMPQVAILFCPALDISGDGDSTVFDSRRDAMSVHLSMRLAKTYIDKKDPHDPNLSPMYAEIGAWFPATYMTTGTRDMMISNVLRFTDKLKKRPTCRSAVQSKTVCGTALPGKKLYQKQLKHGKMLGSSWLSTFNEVKICARETKKKKSPDLRQYQ